MAKTDITTSLETNSQIPLDAKVVVKTLDELRRAVENEVGSKVPRGFSSKLLRRP